MTLKVPSAPLTITLAASSISTQVRVDADDYTIDYRKFQRKEFSNAFLMNLPESDGSSAIFIKNATGKPVQINFNCGSYSPRSVLPDDQNVQAILQKFMIKSYTLRGGPTAPSNIDQLFAVAQDHKERLASFEGYLDLFSLSLSYEYFVALQSLNFSYLFNSGLNLAGGELMNETNCIISSFQEGVLYTDPRTSTVTCKDWGMTVQIYELLEPEIIYQS